MDMSGSDRRDGEAGLLTKPTDRKKASAGGGKGNNIQAVRNAIEVLKSVSAIRHPALLREIAAATDLSASRAHRYLASLCETGLLVQDATSGRYEFGPTLVELGVSALGRIDAVRLGSEALLRLNELTGLDSHLNCWGTNGPTVLKWEPGHFGYAVRIREGRNLPVLLTATGRVFLAYLPASETAAIVENELVLFRDRAGGGPAGPGLDVASIRADVRRTGLACSLGEMNSSISALSAPAFDRDNRLSVTLTVLGIAGSFDTSAEGQIASHLRTVAAELSRSLGAPAADG